MFNNRLDELKERISEHEDKQKEIRAAKGKKNEDSLRDIWKNNIKQTNICIMGVLRGE